MNSEISAFFRNLFRCVFPLTMYSISGGSCLSSVFAETVVDWFREDEKLEVLFDGNNLFWKNWALIECCLRTGLQIRRTFIFDGNDANIEKWFNAIAESVALCQSSNVHFQIHFAEY